MDSSGEASGKFHSPRPSPVRSITENFTDLESDESRNGFYSPISSPVASMKAHSDDALHTTDRLATLPVSGYEHGGDNYYNCIDDDDSTALIKAKELGVYSRRWYVLLMFSLCSLIQGLAFGAYFPLAQNLKAVFGWSKQTVTLLCVGNNLAFVLAAWPIAKLVERKGIRYGTLVSMALVTLGLVCRCVSSDPTAATWLHSISQGVCGVSAVVPTGGGALLSSLWFPHTQRTTATAVATLAGYGGIALSFLLGPLVVPKAHSSGNNSSNLSLDSQTNATDPTAEMDAVMRYFYYNAGFSALILLLVVLYFPPKPPLPPSVSAGVARLDQREGIRNLLNSKNFLLLATIFSVGTGVASGFLLVLDTDLEHLGLAQNTPGWMVFCAITGGILSGLVVSRIADLFPRKLKLFLVLLFLPVSVTLVWFLLLVEKVIHTDIPSLYTSVVLAGSLITAAQPLLVELSCETAYPTGEGVTTILMTSAQKLVGGLVLAIAIMPGLSVSWINWVLMVSAPGALLLLLMVRESYRRTKVDQKTVTTTTVSGQESDHRR